MNELREREDLAFHELRVGHREGGFQPDDPEGGVVEGGFLGVVGMGGVV